MCQCFQCQGPVHEATCWVLQQEPFVVLCGMCAKEFAKWYVHRQTQFSKPTAKQKELAKLAGLEPTAFTEAAMKSVKG